tara:strand:- start:140 stop:328 length:189 start_codon:yes stop_codon:yes gene_type:complete
MILSIEELKDLTGKERFFAMVKVLRYMGIDHRVRPDGFPVVVREDLPLSSIAKKKVTVTING